MHEEDEATRNLRAEVARLENLPKALTARLRGRPPAQWRESMGFHHMVTGVLGQSGLDGLEAAYRLAFKWIEDEDQHRLGLGEQRMRGVEHIPYFEAALEAVYNGALKGSFESAGQWARHVYAPRLSDAELNDYIQWEQMGEDVLDGPEYLVARHPVKQAAIWVFDNRAARSTLQRWLREGK